MEIFWSFLPLLSLASNALSVAVHVLFACAAYQDAKSLNNKDATMWAVLIGLLGLIPGIIYLCTRKNHATPPAAMQQICVCCHVLLMLGTVICPCCGAQQPVINPYMISSGYRSPQECLECHERAKKLLIAAIVCAAALVVAYVILMVAMIAGIGSSVSSYEGGLY